MSVHKRKRNGKITWLFKFDAPGSTRRDREIVRVYGFATKQAAIDAEALRRIEEQKKRACGGSGVVAEVPKTLATLFDEFFRQHADERLALKTVERYREQAAYLAPELVAMPLAEVTPLHLNREWSRLLKGGGRSRKSKTPRRLSAKTVRNIAGVVSSAFARAVKWGLVDRNPVSDSEPPVPKKHCGIALTPTQQDLLIDAASGPWCLPAFLQLCAAIGARRGEVLALRWSDIFEGTDAATGDPTWRISISRSLSQTKKGLEFKSTKTDKPHVVTLPRDVIPVLEAHKLRQNEFRRQFGPDYGTGFDLIFANPDGTPLRPDSVSSAVSLLFRRLKLPKGASLHSLRHSHGSHLLAMGVPLPVVSERLGHSSVRVTADVYSHAIHGQDDEAAQKWTEFQRKSVSRTHAKDLQ
jgi:integrase